MGVKLEQFAVSGTCEGQLCNLHLDPLSRLLPVVTDAHHEVHEGESYFLSGVFDVAINNVYDFQITTPAGRKWAHLVGLIETESETNWWFYENVSIVTPGTALTPRNSNRNMPDASTLTTAYILNADIATANADTAIAGATLLRYGISGAGKLAGGEARQDLELILRAGTSYSLRIEAAAAGYTNFLIEWYEHESGT